MKNKTDVYATAQIDAAIITALDGAGEEPFWKQAYTSTLHQIRIAAIHAGNPEPTIRETAALMENDVVMDGIFEAARAKSRGTELEDEADAILTWLNHDWRGLDHRLREAITDGIRQAAASQLTVQCLTLTPAPTAIANRRGEWIRNGRLLWDTSKLPAEIRTAIEETIGELYPEALNDKSTRIATAQLVDARRNVTDTIEKAIATAASLGIVKPAEHRHWNTEIRTWRSRIKPRRNDATANEDNTPPARHVAPDTRIGKPQASS